MLLTLQKEPKIVWTSHIRLKMRYYGLSEKRVLAILRRPERIEEGIAPKTIAAMQIAGTKKRPTEVWTMYAAHLRSLSGREEKRKVLKMISAWRYPGRTPAGKRPVIPEDTIKELARLK